MKLNREVTISKWVLHLPEKVGSALVKFLEVFLLFPSTKRESEIFPLLFFTSRAAAFWVMDVLNFFLFVFYKIHILTFLNVTIGNFFSKIKKIL
jgi:hypothetical protein